MEPGALNHVPKRGRRLADPEGRTCLFRGSTRNEKGPQARRVHVRETAGVNGDRPWMLLKRCCDTSLEPSGSAGVEFTFNHDDRVGVVTCGFDAEQLWPVLHVIGHRPVLPATGLAKRPIRPSGPLSTVRQQVLDAKEREDAPHLGRRVTDAERHARLGGGVMGM